MITYVGLDVHKRIVEACVLDAAGRVLCRERFELTRARLLTFCRAHLTKESHVALEATTNTWTVVEFLRPFVAEVVVSNPLQTKYIALAKVKTDKVDALVLAQLLRCDFLPRIWQPDAATLELRRLTHRRASLVGQRTAVKNRLHSVFCQRMIHVPCETGTRRTGRTRVSGPAHCCGGPTAPARQGTTSPAPPSPSGNGGNRPTANAKRTSRAARMLTSGLRKQRGV